MKKIKIGKCFFFELPDNYIVVPNLKSGHHPDDPNESRTIIIRDKQGMFSVEKYADLQGDLFKTGNYNAENIDKFLGRLKTLDELLNGRKCELGGVDKWHWCIGRLYDNDKLEYTEYYLACEDCSEMISVLQIGEDDSFSTLLPYIKI